MERCDFLPVSAEEMHERGWWWYDALVHLLGGDGQKITPFHASPSCG